MEADKFKFRTEVSLPKSPYSIHLKSPTFLAGSCFADMIGEKMAFNKFNCFSNPYGNIYNPISLLTLLKNSSNKKLPEEWSFVQNQGRWVNYYFHSEVWGETKEELVDKINSRLTEAGSYLKKVEFLILTLGTAWVYKFKTSDKLVANCHKVPSNLFQKHLLSPKEIIDEYELLRDELLKQNNLRVIFTVSPVRHIKDTIPLNNLSKSVLRTAIHYINESFPETSYFPSYEIMLDDLRDYRFYKNDLIHPTEFAEEYIWDKFSSAYFSEETLSFIREWEKVYRAINHKPFHPDSEEYLSFLKETAKKLNNLSQKANFKEELALLEERINRSK